MNLEQRLRESLVAPDPGAVFTARVMARVVRGRARRGRRFIVIGAVLVAGVAAAMLAVHLTASRTPVAATTVPMQLQPAAMPVASEALTSAVSEVREKKPEHPATEAAQAPVVAGANPALIRIVLMPAQHESQDSAAKPAIDAFHSSLLQALRNSPGVVVELAGPGSASDQPANRVTVVSPRYTTQPSGRRTYLAGDGRTWTEFAVTNRGPQAWPVEVALKLAIQKTAENSVTVDQFIDGNGNPNRLSCNSQYDADTLDLPKPNRGSSGSPLVVIDSGMPQMCSSVDGLAAHLVAAMQPQARKPVADTAQLIARVADASAYDRAGAFRELLDRVRRDGVLLDATAINAITAYINSPMPEQRLSSMLSLRGVRQPGLVAPLLEVLQKDGDEKVRLEALSTLLGDYRSDSRLRAALESVAREDASPFVRMIAQRPLSGDAQWQTYVMSTLADRSLSTTDRLAPAQYDARQVYAPGSEGKVPPYLGSEQFTRQLLDIFQEQRAQMRPAPAPPAGIPPGLAERMAELGVPPAERVVQFILPENLANPIAAAGIAYGGGAVRQASPESAMQSVLSLLTITSPSAAIDLRMRILTETPAPPAWLVTNCLNALVDKRDDPRVSKVLDDIAAGKSGPELRSALERNLAMRPQSAGSRDR